MSDLSACRLSVIVPAYNRASFLPGCVASLRGAGVPNLEIIIVDDGSRDDTRSVVESLGPGLKYIYQENRGLPAARNTGILASTGQYLAYLDSDDYWLPGVAETLMDFLDRHPEVGAVFADARVGNPTDGYSSWIEAAGQQAFRDLPATEPEAGYRVLEMMPFYRGMLRRNAVFTGAIIHRRQLVVDVGMFDPNLKAAEDWELWLRLLHKCPFAFHPEPMAIYTRHADQMTKDTDRMKKAFWDVLRLHSHRVARGPAEEVLLHRAIRDNAFSYGYVAYDRHDYQAARRRFGQAIGENGLDFRTGVYWLLSALPGPFTRFVRRRKGLIGR